MPKQSSEQKLAEIRRLWRSLPTEERRQFLGSAMPRLSDDLLVRVLAIVAGQLKRRELGSYGVRVAMLILADALVNDMVSDQILLHLNDCLALPAAEVSHD